MPSLNEFHTSRRVPLLPLSAIFVSIAFAVVPLAVICLAAFGLRKIITKYFAANETFAGGLALSEALFALGFAAFIGIYDIYKSASWSAPQPGFHVGLLGASTIAGFYLSLKFLSTYAGRAERTELASLRKQLQDKDGSCTLLQRQRNWALQVLEIHEALSSHKSRQFSAIDSCGGLIEAMRKSDSPRLIAAAAHKILKTDSPVGKGVRIGIYFLHQTDKLQLMPIYSYDGNAYDCFDPKKKSSHHRLADAKNGILSAVARVYHEATGTLHLYPDTSDKDSEFEHWEHSEQQVICSALAYKHCGKWGAIDEAFVFYADSAHAGLFALSRQEELSMALGKICKMIEQEAFVQSLAEKTLPSCVGVVKQG